MNFLTTPVLYGLLGATIVLGGVAGVQSLRLANEKAAHSATEAKQAQAMQVLAEASAKAFADTLGRQAQYTQESLAAQKQHNQDKVDAIAKKDRVIADLRERTLQLREYWTCPTPTGATGDATTLARGQDAAADLRAAGAGDLVRILASADADIRWWQAEMIATRKACGIR